jgi:hypothetical protein
MASVIPFPTSPLIASRRVRRNGRHAAPNLILRGALRTVAEQLPEFGRRQFGIDLAPLPPSHHALAPANPHLHAIVNESTGVPVGVVSPEYALIQHADVLHAAAEGITRLGIPVAGCEVSVELSPQGEQMVARFTVPGLHRAQPRDGHPLLPTVMLSNSVDGKSALRANLGWFRLICMNGLVIPYAGASLRRRHVAGLSFGELAGIVERELLRADAMRRALEGLAAATVTAAAVAEWCDHEVRSAWGPLTAMRVFHITVRGMDVVAADPFETAAPSKRSVEDFAEVPGARPFEHGALGGSFGLADGPSGTHHDALQALTWVASRTPALPQRWERESQALALVAKLVPIA